MKKSLVLAMAMALGVTASAYAANPFSDVPAGHWAYDSINKLAAAGVIDGYGDGTFGGDKLMTRYEMAQIVAKAMAKGASVERLAAEFADELDNLGVRVANLEKKADNVKVTGEVRFRYVDQKPMSPRTDYEQAGYETDIRSRIWINGMINDDWTYTGMLQNTQDLSDNAGNEKTDFQRAYVDGKLGGMAVRAGRYNLVIADGNIYDTRADGLELSYGNKLKLKGFAGKATDGITVVPVNITNGTDTLIGDIENGGKYWGLALEGELAKGLKATAGYTKFKDMGTGFVESLGAPSGEIPDFFYGKTDIDNGIWHAGLSYDIGHFNLSAMYLKGDLSADKFNVMFDGEINKAIDQYLDDDGFVIALSYKGAKAEDAGSWGAWAKYYDQGAQTYVAHTTDANTFGMTGFKGFGVGANYTLAKNIVANVAYYNTESKLAKEIPGAADYLDRSKDHRFWTDVTFTF